MKKLQPTMAHQIARAATAFEQQRTGNLPHSVAVVLSDDTLVVTLHGALSPAEKAMAKTPEGAAQVQEFHRQLFHDAADTLRQEIKRITGVAVREATAEVELATGTVVQAFTTGTVVQVFLLAGDVPGGSWRGNGPGDGARPASPRKLGRAPREKTAAGAPASSGGPKCRRKR